MNENELVLCMVETVTPTVTTVRLPDGRSGTIISSEIAPGRIKFMRQYVVPHKRIVCLVLRDEGNNVHLSLRRVTSKDKREVMERYGQEQAITVAFKQILGPSSEELKKTILSHFASLVDFVDAARADESLIVKYFGKDKVDLVKKITEKRKKSLEMKIAVKLTSLESDGLSAIKEVLSCKTEGVSILYRSAGDFSLKLLVEDFKQGKKTIHELMETMAQRAKKLHCEFSFSEGK